MLNQKKIKDLENTVLMPYAMKSWQSRGRVFKEKEHPYRSCYQRDRDRIIHSAAFRRLEYKTQVFVNHEGDYYRTRLTHTLEVAQIARTIASALGLNIDLTEAVALAHDLGHTPFGHSGEEALNEILADKGGFNHNLQGLRVVDYLEERYPDFPGLNLTWEVREGIVKHSSAFDKKTELKTLEPNEMPTLETQVVDVADEIAYDSHDLDDGLASGLIKMAELERLSLWKSVSSSLKKNLKNLSEEKYKYMIIRSAIDLQVTDLIKNTLINLKALKIKGSKEVKKIDKKIVEFSKNMLNLKIPLREFLLEKLYHHYRVMRMSNKAKFFIQQLFSAYSSSPAQLPTEVQKKISKEGKDAVIRDYIAGMTDRYALDEYKKLFTPYEKV